MKRMRLISGFFILLSLLLLGCDDDSTENSPNLSSGKLKRILSFPNIEAEEPSGIKGEYEYDESGRVKRILESWGGSVTACDSFEYNIENQLTKIRHYKTNTSSPTGFWHFHNLLYTYATDGVKEKEVFESPEEEVVEYTLYNYTDGILSKSLTYNNKDELERHIDFEYDDAGDLTKETLYSSNVISEMTVNSYTNGRNIKTDIYRSEAKIHIREHLKTYDNLGRIVTLQSNELKTSSSMRSYVLRYEYYE